MAVVAGGCSRWWRLQLMMLIVMVVDAFGLSMMDTCNPMMLSFMVHQDLGLQCPLHLSTPLQMDGDDLERVLSSSSLSFSSSSSNRYKNVAVLFYDSSSPFSAAAASKFHHLSSIFPRIPHFLVDKSSVMPSLFSRYGIHSLPAFFIINHRGHTRYYGPKHLQSIILFYKTTTGLDPAEYVVYNENIDKIDEKIELKLWYQLSCREIIVKEPFLFFATLFLILRASIYVYPAVLSRIMTLWILCKRQYNLGMFGESSQLLGRVLQLIDVKRVCKTRNFQKGARSARVWASSLASVSLGETSAARPSASVES